MKNEFFDTIASVIEQARTYVGRTVDLTMCVTYFEIGRMIVEQEQNGKQRAEYGCKLLAELSAYLTERFGKGFSVVNLKSFRKFYTTYVPIIGQKQPSEFEQDRLLDDESGLAQKGQTLSAQFSLPQKSRLLIGESCPFKLSWSHYQILMRIKNDQERRFYEIEAINQQWTVRQLQRQYGSSLYERLALSRDKTEVLRLANEGQTLEKPRDMLKNPLVWNFSAWRRKRRTRSPIWNRRLSRNCKDFCSNSVRDFCSSQGKSGSPSTKIILL